jgi:hypothetical protein
MTCFDIYVIYVRASQRKPFWYVEYKARSDESGLSIEQSLAAALVTANRLVRHYGYNSLCVLRSATGDATIDVNSDDEILEALLVHG